MSDKMETATAAAMRMDLRRNRVMPILYQMLKTVRPYLDPENERAERDIYDALMDLLWQNGVEIITDEMRRDIGLPPRDGLGWTPDEIIALERRRLELIMRPIRIFEGENSLLSK